MGYFNLLVVILAVCLAFDSVGDDLEVITFLLITIISAALGITCLKGQEVEKANLKQYEEDKKNAIKESFKRMRESIK